MQDLRGLYHHNLDWEAAVIQYFEGHREEKAGESLLYNLDELARIQPQCIEGAELGFAKLAQQVTCSSSQRMVPLESHLTVSH